jgi:type IV pilus assembly protein PilA
MTIRNTNSRRGFTLVEIMIVVVIIGLLAAMAIPAFQKVRQNSQDKAVMNNLRQLSAAANQYFLEFGVVSVAYEDIVGTSPEHYLREFKPVAGETYNEVFEQGIPVEARGIAGERNLSLEL